MHPSENHLVLHSFPGLRYTEGVRDAKEKYSIVQGWILERSRKTPLKILDIGCAGGYFWAKYLPELLEEGAVSGVDIQPEFLEVAAKRGIATKRVNVDQEPLPYANETFDLVVCDSILEHTLRPRQLFEEMHRVLKERGTLILLVPNAVSAQRRWRTLRGDGQFTSLIDNLFLRDFLKRCSIFYSQEDLQRRISTLFEIKRWAFANIPAKDPSFTPKMLSVWSRLVPRARDVILVEAVRPVANSMLQDTSSRNS